MLPSFKDMAPCRGAETCMIVALTGPHKFTTNHASPPPSIPALGPFGLDILCRLYKLGNTFVAWDVAGSCTFN